MTPRFHCRWILNATPEAERAAKQLDGIRADGFDGVLLDAAAAPLPAAALAALAVQAGERELAVLMIDDGSRELPAGVATVAARACGSAQSAPAVERDLAIAQALVATRGDGRLAMCMAPPTWRDTPETYRATVRRAGRSGVTDWIVGGQLYAFDGRAASGPGHFGWREALAAVLAELRRAATDAMAADGPPALLLETPDAATVAEMHTRLRAAGQPVHLVAPGELSGARVDGAELVLGAARYSQVATAGDALAAPLGPLLADFAAAGGRWIRTVADLPDPPPALASTTSERFTDIAIRWDDVEPEVNALPLTVTRAGDSWRAAFGMDEPIDANLILMEPSRDLRVNGQPVELEAFGAVQVAAITCELLAAENVLEFTTLRPTDAGAGSAPFASLIGDFRVLHATDDSGRIDPARPVLTEPAPLPDGDLAAGGYPYLHRPATVAGTFHTKQTHRVESVQLLQPAAAALRLAIDGVDYGWAWGPDWRVAGQRLAPGVHDIEIALAPLAAQYYAPGQVADDASGLPAFALPLTVRLHPIKDGE